MGLFGGGAKTTTSKTTRPAYVNALIQNIAQQEKQTQLGDYSELGYKDLSEQEQQYLTNLMSNEGINSATQALMGMGEEGLKNLDDYYSRISDVYNNSPTAEDVNALATQLYDQSAVQNEINTSNAQLSENYALGQAPDTALTMQAGRAGLTGQGFGSGARVAQDMAQRGLAQQQQANASNITSTAYQNAMSQAQDLINGQQSNRRAALSALGTNVNTQLGALDTAGSMTQDSYNQAINAALQQQALAQNKNDLMYQSQQYGQNWQNLDIENRLGIANVLNAAQGQTTKTTTSGGSNGMLSGALSLAGTVVGGIYGGPAGAAIGGQLGGMAGTALE